MVKLEHQVRLHEEHRQCTDLLCELHIEDHHLRLVESQITVPDAQNLEFRVERMNASEYQRRCEVVLQ
jgi:hypothetical protein